MYLSGEERYRNMLMALLTYTNMRLRKLFMTLLFVVLSTCQQISAPPHNALIQLQELPPAYEVVILPHHGITGKNIDRFYENLRDEYGSFDRIVIISPDHFWLEKNPVGSLPVGLEQFCYLNVCIPWEGIAPYDRESEIGRIFDASGVTREHGLGEHILRIARYFPGVRTTPILLRRTLAPGVHEQNIADIIAWISERRVLVIASVDFSHHVREDIAKFHDTQTVDTLRFGLVQDFSKSEVDCRNCLAVAKLIAMKHGKDDFRFSLRTSVDEISWTSSDSENTSHVFGKFVSKHKGEDWVFQGNQRSSTGVFLFAGDSHWARGFPYYENKITWYRERITSIFYQQYNPTNNLHTKYHRIFSGFDEVIVNFESWLANDANCPRTSKSTQMWTDPKNISWFHDIGVTLASVANNHSHDCWKNIFDASFEKFLSGWVTAFWYENVAYRTIRGNTYVFLGLDFIESRPDIAVESKRIAALTASGYIVIANLHWWIEYATGHTEGQKKVAHDFIDAWARLVIWHHPHVVEDREIYKGVPIYYSLGNFLFDQPFPETSRWLLVGCEVSPVSTYCRETSIYRDPKTYALSFTVPK